MASSNPVEEVGEIHRTPATLCEFEWRIPSFDSFPKVMNDSYCSSLITFAGTSWMLMIYPNGVYDTVEYIGLCLGRNTSSPPINLKVSFAIKTAAGKRDRARSFADFIIQDGHEAYRTNYFLSRAELLKRKSELLPSNVLTVLCTVKYSKSTSDTNDDIEIRKCSHCKHTVHNETISSHEKNCVMNKPIKCPECSEVVSLKKCFEHKCQATEAKDDVKLRKCSHCKETVDNDAILSHENMCLNKPIKCPECSEVVALKNWYEHKCKAGKAKEGGLLSDDLKKMLSDGKNHDLILRIGDKELRAHRDILRARSHVFESMLSHNMKEKESGVIDVPDCDSDAMELFLSYVYCGEVEALGESNMLGLYYIADKYDTQRLKRSCCDFIKKSLSHTNICDVIQLALNHSDSGLLEYATDYFIDNVLDIMVTVQWQSFLKENSTIGNELLIKSFRKVKDLKN